MKKWLALLLAALLALLSSAWADQEAQVLVVDKDTWLRLGPGTAYAPITVLGAGETREYVGRLEKDDQGGVWYSVLYQTSIGWVSGEDAHLENPAGQSVSEAPTEEWRSSYITIRSAGTNGETGAQIDPYFLGKVLGIEDTVGGWFRMTAPADGDYIFRIYAPEISDSGFTLVMNVNGAFYGNLTCEHSDMIQIYTVEGVQAGDVLTWWDWDNGDNYWTFLEPFMLMVDVNEYSPEPTEAPTPEPTAVPTPTPAPTAVPTPVPTATPAPAMVAENSIGRYNGSFKVEASSYRTSNRIPVYGSCAMDGDLNSAWNTNQNIRGEWLRITTQDGRRYQVAGLRIAPGYWKSSDTFWDNASPYNVEVYCDGSYVTTVTLERTKDYQTFWLPATMTCSSVQLVVRDGYAGGKYSDCCITEVELLGPGALELHSQTLIDWGPAVRLLSAKLTRGGALTNGDRSLESVGLQLLLRDGFGVLDGSVDGAFGRGTEAAVNELADLMRTAMPDCEAMRPGTVDGNYWRNMLRYMDLIHN